MICVTGQEQTVDALARRLAVDDQLHEIRADHLSNVDDELFTLIKKERDRLIFCCRSSAEGGAFKGTETERVNLLWRANSCGVRWTDVESTVPLTGFDRERVVLSWHNFDGTDGLAEKARALSAEQPGVVKLAAFVSDLAELEHLAAVRRAIAGRAVVIGMGAAGLLSRVRYGAFGSAWTYVAATAAQATAPGQLDRDTAISMGLPNTASAPFCGLVGGQQVLSSPGSRVYNRLFRKRGLTMSYLPLVTSSLSRALPVLQAMRVHGLSATMPLKLEALGLCDPDDAAAACGSVNSLRWDRPSWRGTNTDITGIHAPLARAKAHGTALILGAGGAARAALVACERLGIDAIVSARSAHGLPNVVAWEERRNIPHTVLINATPVSGTASPWPDDAPLANWVFDLAIANESALLNRARKEGRHCLDALEMWVHQGAQQMSWMLDEEVSVDELRSALT